MENERGFIMWTVRQGRLNRLNDTCSDLGRQRNGDTLNSSSFLWLEYKISTRVIER